MVFEARTIVTKEIGRDHQVSIVMEESDKDSTPNASAGDLQPGNECGQGTNAARERLRPEDMFRSTFTWN